MLIDEGFKTIYLNYKIKEMVPFLKKLTPKDKKEVVALLRKHRNKKRSCNTISVLASLICCKAGNEYNDKSGHNVIPAYLVDDFFETCHPEKTSFLNNIFNSYQSVYFNSLIKIVNWRLRFSGSFFSRKNNGILSGVVYQSDIDAEMEISDVRMKLDLPSKKKHYLFLSSGLFNKFVTLSGTAFEALPNKAVSDDFKVQEVGRMNSKKVSFEWTFVRKFTESVLKLIHLISSCNITIRKLLIPIFLVGEKSVFNGKKPPELYHDR